MSSCARQVATGVRSTSRHVSMSVRASGHLRDERVERRAQRRLRIERCGVAFQHAPQPRHGLQADRQAEFAEGEAIRRAARKGLRREITRESVRRRADHQAEQGVVAGPHAQQLREAIRIASRPPMPSGSSVSRFVPATIAAISRSSASSSGPWPTRARRPMRAQLQIGDQPVERIVLPHRRQRAARDRSMRIFQYMRFGAPGAGA